MAERALFLNRTNAFLAIIRQGRNNGLDDETIAKKGKIFPAYVRGEFRGFEAWLPPSQDATYNSPIYEEVA